MTTTVTVQDIYRAIRDVPDFPKPGILFKDITPLLLDSSAVRRAVELLSAPFAGAGVTRVVSIESRGFLLGAPVALALDAGLVPIRKPGKLPAARGRRGRSGGQAGADVWRRGGRVHLLDRAGLPERPRAVAGRASRGLATLHVTPLHCEAYAPVAQVDRAAVS